MTSNYIQIANWLTSKEIVELQAWLLNLFAKEAPLSHPFISTPSHIEQITSAYMLIDDDSARIRIKESLRCAIFTHDIHVDGERSLVRLSQLATSVKSSPSLLALSQKFLDHELEPLFRNGEHHIISELISCLRSDPSSGKSAVLFESLYYDRPFEYHNAIHPQHTAQIFIGLCEQNPNSFTDHVSLLLRYFESNKELFKPNYLIRTFANTVSLHTIASSLVQPDSPPREFLEWLFVHSWSPLTIDSNFYIYPRNSADRTYKVRVDTTSHAECENSINLLLDILNLTKRTSIPLSKIKDKITKIFNGQKRLEEDSWNE